LAARDELAGSNEEDRSRAAARVLVWAASDASSVDIARIDALIGDLSPTARWEWWGARAAHELAPVEAQEPRSIERAASVLVPVRGLVDVPAPLGSRGPALAAGARLARHVGDGEAARRMEVLRRALALSLREGAPPAHRAALAQVSWLEQIGDDPTP